MIKINIGLDTAKLPETWLELIELGRYESVMKVITSSTDDDAENNLLLKLFFASAGIDAMEFCKKHNLATITDRSKFADSADLYFLDQLIDEVLPICTYLLDAYKFFTKNPIPFIKVNGQFLSGPSDYMYDQSGESMVMTHFFMTQYSTTPTDELLCMIIASNYLPRIEDGKRARLNTNTINTTALAIASLSQATKYGIFLFLIKCEQFYRLKYPYLYPEDEVNKKTEPKPMLWREILFNMSGEKLGPSLDNYLQASREEIFFALDQAEEKRMANTPLEVV
jgi:hypothetical protein